MSDEDEIERLKKFCDEYNECECFVPFQDE